MSPQAGDRSEQHRFDALALANLARHLARDSLVRFALHEAKCFAYSIFGENIEEWRLAKVDRQRLFERSIKNRVAGSVHKISQQDSVLVRKRNAFAGEGEV